MCNILEKARLEIIKGSVVAEDYGKRLVNRQSTEELRSSETVL
jgi:hypothetical protein